MKLSQLAARPQLVKFTLDENDIIAEYGEAIEFWSWDRQPLETFMKLANADQSNIAGLIDVVRTLILDEEGKQLIEGDNMLPSNLLIKAIGKIVETLGK